MIVLSTRRRLTAIFILAVLCKASPTPAVEPWAGTPPVVDGLAMWLDAGSQEEAHRVHKVHSVFNGRPIGVWYDGSGNARHLVQRSLAFQPRFIQLANRDFGAVRRR